MVFCLCPLHSGVLVLFFLSPAAYHPEEGILAQASCSRDTFFSHPASFTLSLLKLLSCPKRVEQVAAVSGCECVCVCCGLRGGQ
ncbi:hypothetical protein PDJAM_G00152860 [Pangasius djambal]|uniref:Uncharacterized protein n=1 Tax=Pangasius djambal TaxID=1691987 RepID=A0ACC5ZH68_9TELE|nr:hypothetical protein [Pangasius djambal]